MKRRGISLVELLAVMTATVVVTGIATGLLHRSLERQSASRRVLERERAIFAASRQVRADVRRATSVERPDGGEALLLLVLAEHARVAWRATDEGLERVQVDASGRRRREDYRLAEPGASPVWQIRVADGLLTLSAVPRQAGPTRTGEAAAGDSAPGEVAGVLSRSPDVNGVLSRSPLCPPEMRVEIVARLPEGATIEETEE